MKLSNERKDRRNVTIGSLNIHGFTKKRKDPDFIKIAQKHDFLALLETWTTVQSNINMPLKHKTLHKTRNKKKLKGRPSGGILFLYHEKYAPYITNIPTSNEDTLIVKVSAAAGILNKDLYIVATYIKPKLISEDAHQHFEFIKQTVAELCGKGETIILGDFNARTEELPDFISNDSSKNLPVPDCYSSDKQLDRQNCDKSPANPYGKLLLDLCKCSEHRIVNGRLLGDSIGYYTFFSPQGCSVVDYILAREDLLKRFRYLRVQPEIHLSDHSLLSLGMTADKPVEETTDNSALSPKPGRFIWDETSADNFLWACQQDDIKRRMATFLGVPCPDNTDDAAKALADIYTEAGSKSLKLIPPKRPSNKKKRTQSHKWYDDECHSLKGIVRRARRQMLQEPFNKELRNRTVFLCSRYKKLLRRKEREFKSKLLHKLTTLEQTNPREYWRILDTLRDDSKGEGNTLVSNINTDKWVEHFSELAAFTDSPQESKRQQEVEQMEQTTQQRLELDKPITISEVKKTLRGLKSGKASSGDLILNEMLKSTANLMAPLVTKLFNHVLEKGHFPQSWNTAYQVPILKKGDPLDCNNYRGISLTSCIGKAFTSLMNSRLHAVLEMENLMSICQSSFRKEHSTTDHIFTLHTVIDKYIRKNKKKLYCCFVDLAKAFDSVPHSTILSKLLKLGLGGKFYVLVKSMLQNAECCIKLPLGLTKPIRLEKGIRQGDSLSPTLFNLAIDDIVAHVLTPNSDPITINDTKVNCLLYADDMTVLSETPEGLQACLDRLGDYCHIWGLKVNTKKTKVMIFQVRGKKPQVKITLNGDTLEVVAEYTYLGILFTTNGSFKSAIMTLKAKAAKAMFKIQSILHGLSKTCVKLSLRLFDCLVRPILTYGCQVWGTAFVKYVTDDAHATRGADGEPTEKLCSAFYKYTLGLNKYAPNTAVRGELGRYPMYVFVLKQVVQFWCSLKSHEGKLAHRALLESELLHSGGTKNWSYTITSLLAEAEKLSNSQLPRNDPSTLGQRTELILKKQYIDRTEKRLADALGTDSRLSFYSQIAAGSAYKMEPYLSYGLPKKLTTPITQLRTGCHPLPISTGRQANPPVSITARTCKVCPNTLGDETHFLLFCTITDNSNRTELFQAYNTTKPHENNAQSTMKHIISPNDTNKTICLGKYIRSGLDKLKTS